MLLEELSSPAIGEDGGGGEIGGWRELGVFAPNLGIGDLIFVSEMTIMAPFSALLVHVSFI